MKKNKWSASFNLLKNYLQQSGQLNFSSKRKTALSLTVGFYLGIFPIIGTTTILCLLVSFVFRLNILILQAYNILFAPLQIFTAYIFLKAGRTLFFSEKEITPQVSIKEIIHAEKWDTFYYLLQTAAGGIFIWALFFIATGFLLNILILRILNKNSR